MADIDITLSKEHLDNQTQRLVDELGYSKEEARIIYKELEESVQEEINRQNKDWDEDCIKAMSNLMIAVQIQTNEQVNGEIPDKFDVFQGIVSELTS